MRSSSTLTVRYTGKIVLAGPKHLETLARRRLAQVLYEGFAEGYPGDEESFRGLSECYYLDQTGRAAVQAEIMANEVQYIVRGSKIVIGLKEVDVLYRNGGDWKWWIRARNGKGTRDPGEPA